jgi:hypothetical protein
MNWGLPEKPARPISVVVVMGLAVISIGAWLAINAFFHTNSRLYVVMVVVMLDNARWHFDLTTLDVFPLAVTRIGQVGCD